jgi:secretion/DNA translocation related CpaE-like protein
MSSGHVPGGSVIVDAMAQVRRIVAITADRELSAAAVRLGALAGAAVDVLGASDGVRASWRSADAVILGADLACAIAASDPGRRPGVVVITAGPRDDGLWRAAVQLGAVGLFSVPDEERDVVELIVETFEPAMASSSVLAVVGGCGGAGASTVAATLALVSARSRPTVVVDGDRLGGGLDVLLGVEHVAGLRWPELADTRGRLQSASFAERLPQVAGCAVLSWDRASSAPVTPDAGAAVVAAAARAFELVVIDLPRSLDAAGEVLASAADRIVVVTTSSIRAIAATASLLADLAARLAPVDLVVRDPGGGRLSVREVERAVGVPVRATISSESAVAAAAERGELSLVRRRGSLVRTCAELLSADVCSAA